ncbi:MAG: hypothetical protein ABFS46_07300 [Myxococcota bacterium]
MMRIVLAVGIAAAFCLGAATAWAEPPGHARGQADAEAGDLFDRVIDTVRGHTDSNDLRQRQNPNSNAQWLPDAKRGQARAAERRPAHAGPKAKRGEDGPFDLLDFGPGEAERRARVKQEHKRKEALDELRQKRAKRKHVKRHRNQAD